MDKPLAPAPAVARPASPETAQHRGTGSLDKAAQTAPPPLTVHFAVMSSRLGGKDRRSLDQLARRLRQSADSTVVVDGHTDNSGLEAYNYRLSHLRAASVKRYLVSRGVPSRRLSMIWHGPVSPVADNASIVGRKENRRAVIMVTMRVGDAGGVK